MQHFVQCYRELPHEAEKLSRLSFDVIDELFEAWEKIKLEVICSTSMREYLIRVLRRKIARTLREIERSISCGLFRKPHVRPEIQVNTIRT